MIHYWPSFVGVRDAYGLNIGWAHALKVSLRWRWNGREHRLRLRVGRYVLGGWPAPWLRLPRVQFGHHSWIQAELDAFVRG